MKNWNAILSHEFINCWQKVLSLVQIRGSVCREVAESKSVKAIYKLAVEQKNKLEFDGIGALVLTPEGPGCQMVRKSLPVAEIA